MVSWLVGFSSYMVNNSRRLHHEDPHPTSPFITFPSYHTPPSNSYSDSNSNSNIKFNINSNATINSNSNSKAKINSNSNSNSNIKYNCNSNSDSNSRSCQSTGAVPPSPVGARVRAVPCRAMPCRAYTDVNLSQSAWRRKIRMPPVPPSTPYTLKVFVGAGTEIPSFKDVTNFGNAKKMSVSQTASQSDSHLVIIVNQ